MKKQTKKPAAKKAVVKKAAKPEAKKPYGIKAYGKWTRFATRDEYEHYLNDWIAGTDGHEQDRAIKALSDLLAGKKTTDTDKMPEAVPVPKPEAKPAPAKPDAEEKRAKRNAYARAYYQAHREKLLESSRRSHAKCAAATKDLLKAAYDALEGIMSEIGEEGLERYCDPSIVERIGRAVASRKGGR